MLEAWLDVRDYEGRYQASDLGRIKSLPRYVPHWRGGFLLLPERILSTRRARGYSIVALNKDGKVHNRTVHRVIAELFVPNPDGKPCVNHKDFDRGNNAASNLEWVTHAENSRHAKRGGRIETGLIRSCKSATKMNPILVNEIKARASQGELQRMLSREYGISEAMVSMIVNGHSWRGVL